MDRESKKLVCPECHSEDLQIYTTIKKEYKFNIFFFITFMLSGFYLAFNFILTLIPPKFANSPYDYSKINTANFWIINITIPLIIFIMSLTTFIILYNLPKAETKYFCRNCKKKNIDKLEEIIYINQNADI